MVAEVKVTEKYEAAESKMIGKCMATEAETMSPCKTKYCESLLLATYYKDILTLHYGYKL